MFRDASIYVLKQLSEEQQQAYGLRILVMRSWPRGVSWHDIDVWLPSAAPSRSSLKGLKDGVIPWSIFLNMYRACIEDQNACHIITSRNGQREEHDYDYSSLDYLRQQEQKYGIVTLICWEQSERCHRHVLKHMAEDNNNGTMQTSTSL